MPRFSSSLHEGIIKDFYSNHLQKFKRDGILTSPIRKMLREKRKELYLSSMQLAQIMGTTSQSIHNWESGIVKCCQGHKRNTLVKFLLGEFDDSCQDSSDASHSHAKAESLDKSFNKALERANNAMALCRQHSDLREQLIRDIDRSTNKVLLAILGHKTPEHDEN